MYNAGLDNRIQFHRTVYGCRILFLAISLLNSSYIEFFLAFEEIFNFNMWGTGVMGKAFTWKQSSRLKWFQGFNPLVVASRLAFSRHAKQQVDAIWALAKRTT